MKNYRPLLFEDVDLRLPGLEVSCLRLNRHTPEARPEPHQHDHAQILIYLSGSGVQSIDGERLHARPGTVVYVAPGKRHAFERQRSRRPLCLVIDLHLDGEQRITGQQAQLNAADLTRIRARMSELFGPRGRDSRAMLLRLGAVILDVLDPALAELGWLGKKGQSAGRRSTTAKVERALASGKAEGESLQQLARRIGYQQDYLNRLLKAECGATLGQLRAKFRLEEAQRLLRDGRLPIADVAEQVGMLDNNYFARWFKAQTGMTPSAWRAAGPK